MVFKCQEDSFLKEVNCVHKSTRIYPPINSHSIVSSTRQFTSKVVLCEKAEVKRKNAENKDECLSGFNVVLDDTILFPEGGGQASGFFDSIMKSLPIRSFAFCFAAMRSRLDQ